MRPWTTKGALPFPRTEKALTPRSFNALSNGPFGLDLIDASPVSTAPLVKEATAEQKRMVVPEFRTFMTSSGVWGLPETPSISISSFRVILAPKASHAAMVALVSAEMRGLLTVPPGPNAVIRMAR